MSSTKQIADQLYTPMADLNAAVQRISMSWNDVVASAIEVNHINVIINESNHINEILYRDSTLVSSDLEQLRKLASK